MWDVAERADCFTEQTSLTWGNCLTQTELGTNVTMMLVKVNNNKKKNHLASIAE